MLRFRLWRSRIENVQCNREHRYVVPKFVVLLMVL